MRFRGWGAGRSETSLPSWRKGKGGAGRGGPIALLPRPAGPRRQLPPAVDSAPTPLLRGGWGVGGGEGDSAFLQMPGPAFQLQDVDWGCGEAQTGRRAR